MKSALSVRPPYAEQILNGDKVIEFRTVPTNKRERVWVYESLGKDKTGRRQIVGSVEIIGCRETVPGEYEWDLANPKLCTPWSPLNKPQPVFFFPGEPPTTKTYRLLNTSGFYTSMVPGEYAGSLHDKIFGTLDCPSGKRKLKPENRVFFLTWQDAIDCGYRPCLICKPISPITRTGATVVLASPSLAEYAQQESAHKEALATDRLLARMKDDLRVARSRALAAERRAASAERYREALFELKEQANVVLPDWLGDVAESDHAPRVPILVTSDFQWGERITSENMDGLNEYNIEIAEERYKTLINKTVDIAFNQLPNSTYNGIILLRLGDTINGEIHADLRESNVLQAIPAVKSVVESESWGIRMLADSFKKVHVISVAGNHGRTTLKTQAKRGGADNFDTLAAWWLESIFIGDDRVSFQTPDSIDAIFTLHGKRYLATHGDRIGSRGGEGYIGPAATILRGLKRTVDTYAKMGMPLAKIFVGHFHTAYDLGYGWVNGSLNGYSEYARDGRMTPEPAQQWLLFFHPQYGCVSQWPIMVSKTPSVSVLTDVPFAP